MGSSPATAAPASPEFLAVFRAAAGPGGVMSFARFMELALYHPAVGYYRGDRRRVGYGDGTDFYTSSTSGPLFGELVSAACVKLLGDRNPREHAFVEIGAEPGQGVLAAITHPFREVRCLRPGDPLEIAGDCVVFSNELFDAQPCLRTVSRAGRWHEIGVKVEGDRLVETEWPAGFSEPAPEGYHFDRPAAAAELAAAIAAQPWHGLFVAIDYGKTLRDLQEDTPAGTVRAYHGHAQSNDLLSRPGEQDLTAHVCWDWLIAALASHGFASPVLEFQEAFFVRNAAGTIATVSETEARGLSRRKLALLQLLHPSHLGQKFQVLSALR